jgi:hypothetical protein
MNTLPVIVGLGVIVGTHVWMLNELMPPSLQQNHAVGNLVASAAVAYGVFF